MESSNPKVNKIKQELKYDVAKRMIDEGYGIVDIMGNTGLDETEVHLIQCERSGMTKYSLLHEKEKVEYGNEMAKKGCFDGKIQYRPKFIKYGIRHSRYYGDHWFNRNRDSFIKGRTNCLIL